MGSWGWRRRKHRVQPPRLLQIVHCASAGECRTRVLPGGDVRPCGYWSGLPRLVEISAIADRSASPTLAPPSLCALATLSASVRTKRL